MRFLIQIKTIVGRILNLLKPVLRRSPTIATVVILGTVVLRFFKVSGLGKSNLLKTVARPYNNSFEQRLLRFNHDLQLSQDIQ
jgi:hypothetical protein